MPQVFRALALLLVLGTFLTFNACTKTQTTQNPVEQDKDLSHLPKTIDARILDTSVSPCDDFYQYACGNWIKNTEIPPGRPRWARSFDLLEQQNSAVLKSVFDNYAAGKDDPSTPFSKKVGDYYTACLDTAAVETAGEKFLGPQLAKVDKILSKQELIGGLSAWHAKGVSFLFRLNSNQDQSDATRMMAEVDRDGLGMPDRKYYFNPQGEALRKSYVTHIARSLLLAKVYTEVPSAEAAAAKILALETGLAEKMLTIEERRDPRKVYHPIAVGGLKTLAPDLNWDAYFENSGFPTLNELNVTEPKYFQALNAFIGETTIDELRLYMKWQVVRAYSPYLGQALYNEQFEFYGKALQGLTVPLEREKLCSENTQEVLSEAVGEAFVKLVFNEESRTRARAMIEHLVKAVDENFAKVNWMDAPTRVMAQTKLAKIVNKIGYPDKFRNYDGLEVTRTSYVENIVNYSSFERRRDLAKIGKKTDRTEWGMPPQQVNAYYSPNLNEIVFPAAILQPPFFHLDSPLASNFGGIMMVIGHEVTHGFDDSGRQFDELGNLRDWWTKPVADTFNERKKCLEDQYSQYKVPLAPETKEEDKVSLNGKETLGENIADLGGLKLSWAAFQQAKGGKAGPVIADLSDDKQFFIAFAQGWCQKATPEFEKYHAATNVHANPKYRVNGVVVNVPAFQQTFGCPTGAPMAPKNRCEVW